MYYQQQRPWGAGDLYADHWLASAFTVAELGNVLWHKASPNEIFKAYGYVFNVPVPDTTVITPEGVTQCMETPGLGARMLIYLLENKLITLQ
jgi:hypothetical protein